MSAPAGYRGRFAPSPTGPLHFGSLVAAVASWIDARAAGGEWLVRIEDVDTTRSVPGAADAILRALEALGLEWDGEIVWQSRRTERYEEAVRRLHATGLAYACRCSRREVSDSGLPGLEGAVYPGTCRGLGLNPGSGLSIRMIVGENAVNFVDRAAGELFQDIAREIGDFVVKRRDGLHAYQLAVVVDDAEQGITDVVRGADLLWSTPRQVLLQRSLGYPTPRYLHVPVATNAQGEKLSKQTGAPALDLARGAELIREALGFLGHTPVDAGHPGEILAAAAREFVTYRPGGRHL